MSLAPLTKETARGHTADWGTARVLTPFLTYRFHAGVGARGWARVARDLCGPVRLSCSVLILLPFLCRMVEYSLDLQNINLSAIRTVRVLRPLKAINRVPSESVPLPPSLAYPDAHSPRETD